MTTQSPFQTGQQAAYAGTAELWTNEQCLPRYNHDVVHLLSLGGRAQAPTLEFGAGIGTLARRWQNTVGQAPDCVELDPDLRRILSGRGFRAFANVAEAGRTYRHVYTSNVLEHIEDDMAALGQLRDVMLPGGMIAIYVPACMAIYSALDRKIGHFRRYGRAELRQKLLDSGFCIDLIEYRDCAGFLAWWLSSRLAGAETAAISPGMLRCYDRFCYPVSRLLDRLGMSRVLGKNLFALARKPEA